MNDQNNQLTIFEGQEIRRVWQDGEWWFAVVDVIAVLTQSRNPSVYWRVLKKRLRGEGAEEVVTNCNALKLLAKDGKMRTTDCASKQIMFRIIQSIPSPKAEPFRQWLAQVGSERIEEEENADLIFQRYKSYYESLGYDPIWIDIRLRSKTERSLLTEEWRKRGVNKGKEFGILSSIISKETFGLKPSEHKNLKGLKRENLRDHMTSLELIFTLLGEQATRENAEDMDAQGFEENRDAADIGGKAAGAALRAFEEKTGKTVLSSKNFKAEIAAAKALDQKRVNNKHK